MLVLPRFGSGAAWWAFLGVCGWAHDAAGYMPEGGLKERCRDAFQPQQSLDRLRCIDAVVKLTLLEARAGAGRVDSQTWKEDRWPT